MRIHLIILLFHFCFSFHQAACAEAWAPKPFHARSSSSRCPPLSAYVGSKPVLRVVALSLSGPAVCEVYNLQNLQNFANFWRARSRLYRSQILLVNMRWKALAEIYTMHSFAQLCNLIFLSKFDKKSAEFNKMSAIFSNVSQNVTLQNFVLIQPRTSPPKICKILQIASRRPGRG